MWNKSNFLQWANFLQWESFQVLLSPGGMFNMEINHLKSSKAKAEKILKGLSFHLDDTESITEVSFSRPDGWLVRRVLSSYDTCIPTSAKSKNYVPFVYKFYADAKIGKADIYKKVGVSIGECLQINEAIIYFPTIFIILQTLKLKFLTINNLFNVQKWFRQTLAKKLSTISPTIFPWM